MNNDLLKRYIAEIAKQDEIKKQIESLRGQIDVLIQDVLTRSQG